MSRLAGYPAGLLSLLGSQNFGVAPKDLSEVIVPVVDLTSLYLVPRQEIVFSNAAPLANGVVTGGTAIIVPTGEMWYVQRVHSEVVCGAASTATVAVGIQDSGFNFALTSGVVVAANQTRYVANGEGFWLRAGGRILLLVTDVTGVNTSGNMAAIVSKVRA